MDINLHQLAAQILTAEPGLTFNTLEVGAVPLEGTIEPCHTLLDPFPGSRVIALEVDEKLCHELNGQARPGLTYYPVALGRQQEDRPFFLTQSPMCASLYEPDEHLISQYANLEVMQPTGKTTIPTISLERFGGQFDLPPIDFIKIDVQGAELEVFQGGTQVLKSVLGIVTEVEFVPLYKNQPLYGDIDRFLNEQGFRFHRFQGMAGRTLNPYTFNQNPNYATQHLWADAIYLKGLFSGDIPPGDWLKQGVLALLYGSVDVTLNCFHNYDECQGTQLESSLLGLCGK